MMQDGFCPGGLVAGPASVAGGRRSTVNSVDIGCLAAATPVGSPVHLNPHAGRRSCASGRRSTATTVNLRWNTSIPPRETPVS